MSIVEEEVDVKTVEVVVYVSIVKEGIDAKTVRVAVNKRVLKLTIHLSLLTWYRFYRSISKGVNIFTLTTLDSSEYHLLYIVKAY